jgi:hypothetical protein
MKSREQRTTELITKMLKKHESGMDCSTCSEKMQCLAELKVNGGTPDERLAAVQRHIECCGCCAMEFKALVAILQMEHDAEGAS